MCALFAATYPERVAALVLHAVAAVGTATDDFPWQWTERQWEEDHRLFSEEWGTQALAEQKLKKFTPSLDGDVRHRDWYARLMRQSASPNAVGAIHRLWSRIDIRPILPSIGAPTLVMHRTDDVNEHIRAGRDFADRIPGARFLELPGVDNWVWSEDQETVLVEIEQFVTGRRDRPRARDGAVHRYRGFDAAGRCPG